MTTEVLKSVVRTEGSHWVVAVYCGEQFIGETHFLHKPKRDDVKTAFRQHAARLVPGA